MKSNPAQAKNNPAANSDNPESPSVTAPDIIPYWILPAIALLIATILGIMLMPDWSDEWYRYQSLRQAQLGNYEKANEYLEKVMNGGRGMADDDPANPKNNPTFLSESGYNNLVLKNYDKAIEWYTKAQAMAANTGTDDQNNPRPALDFSAQLGSVYYLKGDKEEARKYLEAALARDRLNPEARFYMGLLEYEAKNLETAAEHLKIVADDVRFEDRVKEIYAAIEKELFADIK